MKLLALYPEQQKYIDTHHFKQNNDVISQYPKYICLICQAKLSYDVWHFGAGYVLHIPFDDELTCNEILIQNILL